MDYIGGIRQPSNDPPQCTATMENFYNYVMADVVEKSTEFFEEEDTPLDILSKLKDVWSKKQLEHITNAKAKAAKLPVSIVLLPEPRPCDVCTHRQDGKREYPHYMGRNEPMLKYARRDYHDGACFHYERGVYQGKTLSEIVQTVPVEIIVNTADPPFVITVQASRDQANDNLVQTLFTERKLRELQRYSIEEATRRAQEMVDEEFKANVDTEVDMIGIEELAEEAKNARMEANNMMMVGFSNQFNPPMNFNFNMNFDMNMNIGGSGMYPTASTSHSPYPGYSYMINNRQPTYRFRGHQSNAPGTSDYEYIGSLSAVPGSSQDDEITLEQVDGASDDIAAWIRNINTYEVKNMPVSDSSSSSDDDDDDDDTDDEPFRIDLDYDDEDLSEILGESDSDNEPDPNTDDDATDNEEEIEDTDNLILCQFTHVKRQKNHWKFRFTNGILTIDGVEYIFQRASGEAKW